MVVLGMDTSTAATAVALRDADGRVSEARDDPPAGAHPGHATRLLGMAHELLERAGVYWEEVDRLAVGVGPGTFTGLRVGVASARGLAQSLSAELVGVSSLRALGERALAASSGETGIVGPAAALAAIDARRGEMFLAAYELHDGAVVELAGARALAPADLAEAIVEIDGADGVAERAWLAVGDGAVRYRELVTAAGVLVPADATPIHRVSAGAICELAARANASSIGEVVPDYCRAPDAELSLQGAARTGGV